MRTRRLTPLISLLFITVLIVSITSLALTQLPLQQTTTTKYVLSPNALVKPVDYIIRNVSGTIYVIDKFGQVVRTSSDKDVSDDIQWAQDNLPNGGVIYIEKGEYLVANQINITNPNIYIRGDGSSTKLKLVDNFFNTTDRHMFYVTGDYFKISDIYLYGNKENQPGTGNDPQMCNGIHILGAYAEVTRIIVDDFPDLNIVFWGGHHHRITNILSMNAGRDCIAVDNADYVVIANNVIYNPREKGIGWAMSADHLVVVGNSLYDDGDADVIAGISGYYFVIANNNIEGGWTAIRIDAGHGKIIGNVIANVRRGIYLRAYVDRVFVTDNWIYNVYDNGVGYGIYIEAGSGHVIKNNVLEKCNLVAVYLIGTNNITIENNIIRDNTKGVYISSDVYKVFIFNNIFDNNGVNIENYGTNIVIERNEGYVTENSGVTIIPAGTKSIIINHGLSVAPNVVIVTTNDTSVIAAVVSIDSTSFNVTLSTTPSTPVLVYWHAEYKP